ncbi:fimbria/pilus periplasmic chaperone [Klebsiella aerogenes]
MNKVQTAFRLNGRALKLAAITLNVLCLNILSTSSVQAAIALDRTRIIFDGDLKSVSLNVSNLNKQLPYLAQGWLEDEQGNKISTPLTVLPPVQRIEPGKQSQVKIQALPASKMLRQDRETLYYFNLREIPPKSNKPNTLQIALQTRIKLFYRPRAVAINKNAAPPQEMLTLSRQGDNYIVNNPTPYYVTIIDADSKKGGPGIKDFKPLMIPPNQSLPLTVNAKSVGINPVLTYVNDYGGRPLLSFSCKDNSCTVVPDKAS